MRNIRRLLSLLVLALVSIAQAAPEVGQSASWSGSADGPYGTASMSATWTITGVTETTVYFNVGFTQSGGGGGYWDFGVTPGGPYDYGIGAQSMALSSWVTAYIRYSAFGGPAQYASVALPGMAPEFYVQVNIPANTSAVPLLWELWQDEAVVGSWLREPGAGALSTQVTVPNDHATTLTSTAQGITNDDGGFMADSSATLGVFTGGPYTPAATPAAAAGSPVAPPQPSNLPSTGPGADGGGGGGTIWQAPGEGAAVATDNTVRQATDKQLESLNRIWNRQQTTNDKLDELSEKADITNEKLDDISGKLDNPDELARRGLEADDAKPSVGDMQAAGQAAADQEGDLVPSIDGRSYSVGSSTPSFSLNFFGSTVDWNPFRADRFGPIASWARTFMLWFIVVAFGLWCFQQAIAQYNTLATARQSRGNTVAGTGGQITALINAGLITVATLVCLAAVMAFATTNYGAGSLVSAMGGDPLDGLPGQVAYCLDQVFPVAAMVGYYAGRVVWVAASQASVVVASALIRFFVA